MLSNPPYGKSWKSDLERMGGKDGIKDPRFVIEHAGDAEYSLLTRSSDGQMLFLANMLSKVKQGTKLGSRVAEVHNGSSLFTGDAGQGESNIRRWIIENDWLDAIVALPLNMFYNTGIATYIWVLTNRKPAHRKGRVQLINATQWFKPLRKNLGKKNCELSDEDIQLICDTFVKFEETEQSKILQNAALGYWKVTVERPLRLKGTDPERAYSPKEIKSLKGVAERSEDAPPVIKKIHKKGVAADALRGLFSTTIAGKPAVVEYESDPDLRDVEQVPVLGEGGIDAFLRREVLPYVPDTWYDPESVKTGYEISFARYFYNPQPMRTLAEETDPNKLHDLKSSLDGCQVYSTIQIDELVELYLNGADRDKLDPILDVCVAVYKEQLDEDGQVDFKGKAKAFLRAYGFLSSILPYTEAGWEKLSIFLNFLVSKLPAPKEEDLSKGILEAIDMDSYRVEKKAAVKIQLPDSDAEIEPVPTTGGGYRPEPELDRLSNILKVFNDQFGNVSWTDTDRVHKLITEDIPNRVAADKAYQNAKQNSDKQNARIEHDKALARVMTAVLKDDTELFKQFSDNEGFRRWLTDTVFALTYSPETRLPGL